MVLQVRIDLGVMAMKWFFTLPRAPEEEPHNQMQFSVIPWILLLVGLSPLQGTWHILSQVLIRKGKFRHVVTHFFVDIISLWTNLKTEQQEVVFSNWSRKDLFFNKLYLTDNWESSFASTAVKGVTCCSVGN